MIKFYSGNFIPGIGQAFVVISAEEKEGRFIAENIILFKAFNGNELTSPIRSRHPILGDLTLSDFVANEVEFCKNDIFFKIIYHNFQKEVERVNGNIQVLLTEDGRGILLLLKDKFPSLWQGMKDATQSEELRTLLQFYESIKIERDVFEIKRK